MATASNPRDRETPVGEPSTIDLAERLESVKAGTAAALTAALVFGALILVKSGFRAAGVVDLALLQPETNRLNLVFSVVVAVLSGFLFGITYRYIIRQDNNPHLGSGAVLAFGLVRSLAQVDIGFSHQASWLLLVLMPIESILLFGVTRFALDWLLSQAWIKGFR